jgi:hypothetical protein
MGEVEAAEGEEEVRMRSERPKTSEEWWMTV